MVVRLVLGEKLQVGVKVDRRQEQSYRVTSLAAECVDISGGAAVDQRGGSLRAQRSPDCSAVGECARAHVGCHTATGLNRSQRTLCNSDFGAPGGA